jgi:DNA-binding GntR family transcriptional regulator
MNRSLKEIKRTGTLPETESPRSHPEARVRLVNSARVSRELEAAILSGQFRPRERLIEMDLIGQFRVSRTVIREALKKLESKGLVRAIPYRGVLVADLTAEEVEEIYFVRTVLEKIAAGLLLKHIQPKDLEYLKKLSRELEKHLREKTPRAIEIDSEFHRAMVKAAHNQYLYDLIDFLRVKCHIVRFNAWSHPGRIEKALSEHKAIMKAIEGKDLKKLERAIAEHLSLSKNSYLSQLKGIPPRFGMKA